MLKIDFQNGNIDIFDNETFVSRLNCNFLTYQDAVIFSGTIICRAFSNYLNSLPEEKNQIKITGFQQ